MKKISAVIVCKNEEENIKLCLENIKWVDEIIIADNCSTDKTVQICKEYTDRIYSRDDVFRTSLTNLGIEKASNEWVINIDVDERITEELKSEINQILEDGGTHNAYYVPFKHYFIGKWMKYGGWFPSFLIRLYRKDAARYDKHDEHVVINVQGKVGHLKNSILHYGFGRNIRHFMSKHNFYSTNIAAKRYKGGIKMRWSRLFIRPGYIFLKRFLFLKGYMDGTKGFILMVLYTFFLFLEEAKLWELWLFGEEKKIEEL